MIPYVPTGEAYANEPVRYPPLTVVDISAEVAAVTEVYRRRGERCVGTPLDTAKARTDKAGRFQVGFPNVPFKGIPFEIEACGMVVVREGGGSDTISGIEIRYRDPPPETANVRVILR